MKKMPKDPAEALRAYHWFEQLRSESSLSLTEIDQYPGHQTRSRGAAKWEGRIRMPAKPSVMRLKNAAPVATAHYLTAPYELLSDRQMACREIRRLVARYLDKAGDSYDRLPKNRFSVQVNDGNRKIKRADSRLLAQRGDIYAFLAILALVREAEAKRDEVGHLWHLRALYTCLPALGRFEWLKPDFGLLCRAVSRVHRRVKCSKDTLGVDWNIVIEQFNDPGFEPDPALRPKDPDTGRPVAIADTTFLIKALDRGQMPKWIGEETDHKEDESTAASHSFSYDEINEMHGDQLLFMAFMQTMHVWDVKRSDWEACLGVGSSTLTSWIDFGVTSIGFIPRMRILALVIVRELLHRDSTYRADCSAAIRSTRLDLNGVSIFGFLRAGNALELLRCFDESSSTSGPIGAAGMLPLVSAGVFRIPREVAAELRQNTN